MILSMGRRTSEAEIYHKMNKLKLENVYKTRLLMFIFKNKELFELHNTEMITRTGNSTRAKILNWNKEHSRKQARFQGIEIFNNLPVAVRNERKISVFKREIKKIVGKN